jgi:hypothetical protein
MQLSDETARKEEEIGLQKALEASVMRDPGRAAAPGVFRGGRR